MVKRDDGLEGKLARLRALERESPPTAVNEIREARLPLGHLSSATSPRRLRE
ncbi:MAG: hypothetical protein U0263_39410 [Polyangiaceae bacterium]